MSNFSFLSAEWPAVYSAASMAEAYAKTDPRSACFYARRALELGVDWLFENDGAFKKPYDASLNARMTDVSFRKNVPQGVAVKADLIRRVGNQAVHSQRAVREGDALAVVQELFHVCYWLARTYKRDLYLDLPQMFDPTELPPAADDAQRQSAAQLQKLAADLTERDKRLAEQAKKLADYETLVAAQERTAEVKARNVRARDPHDYNEAQTRERIIDLTLQEAGWDPKGRNVEEVEIVGMPDSKTGKGFVDYVLWGDDGLPLALVEAKRTSADPQKGRTQAKMYADALEGMHGRRPVIFYTNGYSVWLWDDARYPPREVQGFLTKDELERLIQRRTTAADLSSINLDKKIVDRYYQEEGVRAIAERFSQGYRDALLVMATGTGKTRTAVALVDVLMRANLVKRVLFLADRKTLVKQAVGAFKRHLPASNPVNLLTEREAAESRVVVSTYHTMMGLIDERKSGGERLFGPGHFDVVIIDEAHRSVYRSFGAIFTYFDSLLVGLTATPKDEVDRNTYDLFGLESGVPTYAYELDKAVADGYLVPPNPITVPTKFLREGIRYDDLSVEEQEAWEELEWREGETPDEVRASDLNKWLFNQDTVDKVLKHLMEAGEKVAGGDRLGKTIIFAQNHRHAEFISRRFDANYPHYRGEFARVIDNYEPKAESLIDAFSLGSAPHIAISVDMLDTGVDIPEVVNLVFFKIVRSKTKFFQMLGRGTRLSGGLYGPGEDKTHFNVFDYVQNFEFFNQNPKGVKGYVQEPLSQKVFKYRLDLLGHLARFEGEEMRGLERSVLDNLHAFVAAMPLDNFIVRPKRRYVEPFARRERWDALSATDRADLGTHVSGLPSAQVDDDEDAKRFDALALALQLALSEGATSFKRYQGRVVEMAANLETKPNVPDIKAQLPLIRDVQTEDYWQNASLPGLEHLRLSLRGLVRHVESESRAIIYSNFTDELGEALSAEVSYLTGGVNVAQYRKKVESFLREHRNDDVMVKVRKGLPLTTLDLDKLEALLFASGSLESRQDFEKAYGKRDNLGLFIRQLVGLDRRAAKDAFGRYLDDKIFTAEQIQFVSFIIDHLTRNGVIEPTQLFERPYTDLHENGLDGLFTNEQATELVTIIRAINGSVQVAVAQG